MTVSSKRAEYIAWVSLVLSVVFFLVAFFIGRWSEYFAVYEISWLILSAVLIWLVLAVQFHQRSLAEQEKLDIDHSVKGKGASAIFEDRGEHAELFAVAQRRLVILEKWFIPAFSVIIAAYQIGMGLYLLKAVLAGIEAYPKEPLVCAMCMTAIAFVNFLMSRYATGMSASSQAPGWKPLRAGGSFLLGVAVLCFTLAIALVLAQYKIFAVLSVAGWLIAGLLVVLGLETSLNVILDIYRPKLKGRYARSAFDSRLLGVINEPGGVFRSLAGAIDYQFGFNISQTWFYKLLEKAVVPLILFCAVTLYLLSCMVVVAVNEEAIIEHFGNPADKAGVHRIIKPGLAFKWPWPIDKVYKYPTKRVSQLSIGFVPDVNPDTGQVERKPRLWGKQHYAEEYNLLVASESPLVGAAAAPVSLVVAAVPVHYRVKDLYKFVYNHNEPKKLLESICYRELTRFAASAGIEVDSKAGMDESLFGAGRNKAKEVLTDRIQKAADREGLGIEIVFLGLQGIHPHAEVAADYQKVVGAVQKKQSLILLASAKRNMILSSIAGSVADADDLFSLASEYQKARAENKEEQIEKLGNELDSAFAQAGGNIFKTLREAQSYAFEKKTIAEATGLRFDSQLKAYNAAPEIYKCQQRLAMLEEALDTIRKYIVVADTNDTQVFQIDVQEKLTPSLYELGGIEESKGK